jgi:hypothetical protein
MNTTQMVTEWIARNGIGSLAQYNVAAAAKMIDEIAAEEFHGIVTTVEADLVEAVIESYRTAA